MKTKILGILLAFSLSSSLFGQSETINGYRNFPIVLTLQFHSISMPFRDLKSNFSNVGIGLGTELSLNGKPDWVQQFNVVWYRNKSAGNGLLLYTQTAFRPGLGAGLYTEVKLGAGYLYSDRPVESYQRINGQWVSAGHKGKGMLALPIGVSLGYDHYSSDTYFSPFASYQFLLLKGFSKSIPLVPESLVQVGSRIHLGR